MKITINMSILKAAHLFTSKESTRYYLNGVAIEWNGAHLTAVATDGHRLVAFNLPHDDSLTADDKFSIIIPNDVLKNWKLNKNFNDAELSIETAPDGKISCALHAEGTGVMFSPIDGVFPDWRRIIPAELSGDVMQFNTAYLDDFTRATKILYGKERFITVRHNGEGPAVIDMASVGEFEVVAVLMPRRGSEIAEYSKPEFCK